MNPEEQARINSALYIAVRDSNPQAAGDALARGANANLIVGDYTFTDWFVRLGLPAVAVVQTVYNFCMGNTRGAEVAKGDTILHIAARKLRNEQRDRSFDVLQILLANGAGASAKNKYWEKPEHLIDDAYTRKAEVVALLHVVRPAPRAPRVGR